MTDAGTPGNLQHLALTNSNSFEAGSMVLELDDREVVVEDQGGDGQRASKCELLPPDWFHYFALFMKVDLETIQLHTLHS